MPHDGKHQEEGQAPGARAVLRVLAVLTELAAQPEGMTLAELTPRLAVPKASMHRLLQTLRQSGYLTLEQGIFRLGPATTALARMIADSAPTPTVQNSVQPVLEWLELETNETAMIGLPDFELGEVEYVAVVESHQSIRFSVAVGDRRPFYSAASGQVFLAYLTGEALRRYLEETKFVAITPQTCDASQICERLPTIRETGLAIDCDGRVMGASSLASPIFDQAGTVCATISVAGPTDRIIARQGQLGDRCQRAGARASRILGFRGSYPNQQ